MVDTEVSLENTAIQQEVLTSEADIDTETIVEEDTASLIETPKEISTETVVTREEVYVTNQYITNPVIRETVREVVTVREKSSSAGANDFVSQSLFDLQTEATQDQVSESSKAITDSIAESVATDLLTVTGNTTLENLVAATTTLSGLTVTGDTTLGGSLTLAALAGGLLTTDANGLVSTTTIGSASINADSLDFDRFVDDFTLDATATFDLDTNGADWNIDSGTFFVDGVNNRVGIGTTSPWGKLSVEGTGNTTGKALVISDTNDVTRFVVQDNGKVGIGTTNPSVALDIDTLAGVGGLRINNSNADNGTLFSLKGNAVFDSGTSGQTAVNIHGRSGQSADIFTIGSTGTTGDYVTVNNSGNVGIGTTTPAYKLDVYGGSARVWNHGATTLDGLVVQNSNNKQAFFGMRASDAATISIGDGITTQNVLSASWTSKSLAFSTNGSERVRIDSSGNVGIGTTSPAYKLDISNSGSSAGLRIGSLAGSSVGSIRFMENAGVSNDTYGFSLAFDAGANDFSIMRHENSQAGTEALTILRNNGNVGIGTTSPGSKLDVTSSGSVTVAEFNTDGNATLEINRTGSSPSANTLTSSSGGKFEIGAQTYMTLATNGAEVVRILNNGNVGIGTTTPSRKLTVYTTGTSVVGSFVRSDNTGAYITFSDNTTSGDAQVGVGAIGNNAFIRAGNAERVRITSAGNVGIGTTTPSRKLTVSGTVGFSGLTANTGAGSLCLTTGGEVVYNSGSDNCLTSTRETKHDIYDLALDASIEEMITTLQPVSFIYNIDETERVRYGFIADDSALIDEHLGTYNQDDELTGLDTNAFLALIVSAIKDIYETINGFKDRFVTKEIVTKELCVGDTCVDEVQLKQLLEAANANSTSNGNSDSGSTENADTNNNEPEENSEETEEVEEEGNSEDEEEISPEEEIDDTEVVEDEQAVDDQEETEEDPTDEPEVLVEEEGLVVE